ncbi:MAG: hypothetical protein IT435_15985 [Phycisphaerales bacterium]|nr:hypothetical protein [Phycisphaerales bacterium]
MTVRIFLDRDASGEEYDERLADVQSGTDYEHGTEFISKVKGTHGGNPCVMIRFRAAAPGSDVPFWVCTVVTLKELLGVAQAMQGAHGSPDGVLGIIGTISGDVHVGHSKTCGLRTGGLCNCERPKPVAPAPAVVVTVPLQDQGPRGPQHHDGSKPFDYGDKLPDGQHLRHPTNVPADRTFVRPVRLSYIHQKCGVKTSMPQSIAETYAANPAFYGRTFCCGCGDYFPVGANGDFVWDDGSGQKVGT